jgi:selenocysteine-specific elongation factor
LELARAEVEDYVAGSFLEGAPVIAVSSRTLEGIEDLKHALVELAARIQPKATMAVARLPVDRAFSIKGFGTVVTGTLIAGELKPGDEVEILPAGTRSRIRNVQVHGRDTDRALAGQRTAINLQGINVDQVERGSVLAPAGRLRATSMLDVRLDLLASAPRPLTHRARVRLHHGTSEVMARVVVLGGAAGDDAARHLAAAHGIETRRIEPGASRIIQLRLEEPITALPGDRFIIRSYSPQVTIGGGVIIDALPDKHRIRDREAVVRLEQLERAAPAESALVFIEMSGASGMSQVEIAARTGATDEQIQIAARELVAEGRAFEVSTAPMLLISAESFGRLAARVIELLKDYHRREPLSLGLSREEVRERVFGDVRPEVFRAVVARLAEEGKVAAERDALRLASHSPALGEQEATAKQALEAAFKASGLQAGTLEEIAAASNVPVALARKLYTLLAAERRILRIGDMIFHADSLEDLKARVRAQKAVNPRMDVAAFKEITGGLTRKHAIPLLEYLDRERITRRTGNEREIL